MNLCPGQIATLKLKTTAICGRAKFGSRQDSGYDRGSQATPIQLLGLPSVVGIYART